MKISPSFFIHSALTRIVNRSRFEQDFLRTLPNEFHLAARYLFYPLFSRDERRIAAKIESFRSKIKDIVGSESIETYGSPKSGTFRKDESGHSIVDNLSPNEVDRVAKTGASPRNGILLRRIVEGTGSKRILELGTNTGFSGSYFLSVPDVELVTVEGSAQLCEVARKNMSRISDSFVVKNMLFDQAIDELIEAGERFDCVFIDGQHEREATIHYAKRVRPLMEPGSYFVFDDIYWSDGMNQAWKDLCRQKHFSHTVDLLYKGLCLYDPNTIRTEYHDLGDILPRTRIYRKNHWAQNLLRLRMSLNEKSFSFVPAHLEILNPDVSRE